jgi:DNA repair exonuclease SbcCD nuclease subunit
LRIIHTSDIHLSSKKKERLEALQDILAKAGENKADLVVIGGDLFDSNEEADILRPRLRKMLSSLPFSIIAIPGNHDMEAFSSDMNFGDSIEIYNKLPFDVMVLHNIRIIAVPYANQSFNELAGPLKQAIDQEKTNILLIHCSLDIPYLGENEYGDEKRQAYLPVNSKVLGGIGFNYVLAGHFHTRTVESRLSEKTMFLYSGSPVSISRKEKGRRTAVLLDTEKPVKDGIKLLPLDSFYYEEINISLTPEKEKKALQDLEKTLEQYRDHKVDICLNIGGFISSGENQMAEEINMLVKKNTSDEIKIGATHSYRDISAVLQDPLYTAFMEKLEGSGLEEGLAEDIEDMVKLQFSRLKSR